MRLVRARTVSIVLIVALIATLAGCGTQGPSNPNWPDGCLWILGIGGCL